MFKKKDIILIAVVLAIAGVMAFFMKIGQGNAGEQVRIIVDGTEYGTYLIMIDNEINIDTELGHNKVVIRNKEVYMQQADCPDKYCVEHKAITSTNETIVCLPHKLVVEVLSNNRAEEIDSVTQ